jgi:periplasmic protein TonB
MKRVVRGAAVLVLSAGLLWAQKPASASANFEPAEILSAAEAVYPQNSIAAGTVVLQLTIGRSGQVEETKVIHDIPSLTPEAIRSAMKWKFRPAALNGEAVSTKVIAAFTFVRPVLNH